MSYKLYYQLEDYGDVDIERLKNKDDVIYHLMYLLAQHEPLLLQINYPDGGKYQYNQSGAEI